MKQNAQRRRSVQCRKPFAIRSSRGITKKKSSSIKHRRRTPTYLSLLKDVEHALKHEGGASMVKLKRLMEKRYGGTPFKSTTMKMLQSAVKRLHSKGRIHKHPTSKLYKFKPSVTAAPNMVGNRSKSAKKSRPSRSAKPNRKR